MASTRIAETVDAVAAAEFLKTVVQQGDVVLVKASRGMKMEQVVQTVMGMRAIAKQAS
jgi:UDP-N-acetylmuramoyl-tripeptide--D-alanyl-D-alanine ligase